MQRLQSARLAVACGSIFAPSAGVRTANRADRTGILTAVSAARDRTASGPGFWQPSELYLSCAGLGEDN